MAVLNTKYYKYPRGSFKPVPHPCLAVQIGVPGLLWAVRVT